MTMSNIAIQDGKASPETHTFVPNNPQAGNTPAVWYCKVAGLSARAWQTISSLVKVSQDGKSPHRSSMQVHVPKIGLDALENEIYIGKASMFVSVVSDYSLNEDDLKDIFALGKDLLGEAEATAIFTTQKPSG